MNCIYVLISLMYAVSGLVYGYLLWQLVEVIDAYAGRLDS